MPLHRVPGQFSGTHLKNVAIPWAERVPPPSFTIQAPLSEPSQCVRGAWKEVCHERST